MPPDEAADPGRPGEAPLSFPDLPRLELDELLAQLVERAQEVMATQGRLRGLLRAQPAGHRRPGAAGRAAPDRRRGPRAGRSPVRGARRHRAPAAGWPSSCTAACPRTTVARIGHLPAGQGPARRADRRPAPIRLRRIDRRRPLGRLPAGHPPMNSFLGVPIRVRDEVFGNLYLAREHAAASSAPRTRSCSPRWPRPPAVAIENARLYESARSRGEWLQASAADHPAAALDRPPTPAIRCS